MQTPIKRRVGGTAERIHLLRDSTSWYDGKVLATGFAALSALTRAKQHKQGAAGSPTTAVHVATDCPGNFESLRQRLASRRRTLPAARRVPQSAHQLELFPDMVAEPARQRLVCGSQMGACAMRFARPQNPLWEIYRPDGLGRM